MCLVFKEALAPTLTMKCVLIFSEIALKFPCFRFFFFDCKTEMSAYVIGLIVLKNTTADLRIFHRLINTMDYISNKIIQSLLANGHPVPFKFISPATLVSFAMFFSSFFDNFIFL